jgi:hypothetical protein
VMGADAAGAAPGTAAAVGAGTPTAGGGAAAPAWPLGLVAAGRGLPPNIDGWPVCTVHLSHNSTSDMVKTTHSRVRRISVM